VSAVANYGWLSNTAEEGTEDGRGKAVIVVGVCVTGARTLNRERGRRVLLDDDEKSMADSSDIWMSTKLPSEGGAYGP